MQLKLLTDRPLKKRTTRRLRIATLLATGGLTLAILAPVKRTRADDPPRTPLPAAAATSPSIGAEEQSDANLAMAMRFSTAAFEVLQAKENAKEEAAWRQAIVFLEAANKLDPKEPRYLRLRADALHQLNENDDAALALEAYLKLDGSDETARLRLIEHYATDMQTTDAKLKYFRNLLTVATVSNEIKSRCATWAAMLLMERSRAEAVDMIAKAVELDPINIYARRIEWKLVASSSGPDARMKSLLAQLRCNPSQPAVLGGIGQELAAAGLVRESIDWYRSAVDLSIQTASALDAGFLVEYAAQLYLNGLLADSDRILGRVLELNPTNTEGWFLRLVIRKASGQRVAYEQDMDLAKRVFAARAAVLTRRILSDAQDGVASTQPSTQPFDFAAAFAPAEGPGTAVNAAITPADAAGPSPQPLAEAIQRLNSTGASSELRSELVASLIDLAWFEIYFDRSEVAAPVWMEAVKKLLPADDVNVVRLQGWYEYLTHKDAEAMKRLWTIRDRDVIAAMGVAEMLSRGGWATPKAGAASQPATRPAELDPDVQAQKLFAANPRGLLGVTLAAHFKDRKLALQPKPFAEQIKKQVLDFPLELIRVVDRPDKFYVPVGEQIKMPYRLGEPILAKVTLRNLNNYDLPIGPDGIIKPDLWFDARVNLGVDKLFPMSGNERATGLLVLKAHSNVSQIVRIDQGPLAEALRERPAGPVDIYMTVMTNPMIRSDYSVVPGPSGVRKQFTRSLVRGSVPVLNENQRKKLIEQLNDLPSVKLWTLDVMSAIVEETRRNSDADSKMQAFAPELIEQINKSQSDRVPMVGGWAMLQALRLMDPGDNAAAMRKIVETSASSKSWEVRLLAVWGAKRLDPADRQAVGRAMMHDPNELVQRAATAEVQLVLKEPATRPTTRKSRAMTGPSTTPSALPALPGPALQGPPLPGTGLPGSTPPSGGFQSIPAPSEPRPQ